MVQGSRISASIYLFVCLSVCNAQKCKKYLIQFTGVATCMHSVCGHTHKANVILKISGHELLFTCISLAFMVQNDYGF